jgi:hypothetical protein
MLGISRGSSIDETTELRFGLLVLTRLSHITIEN